MSTVIDGLNCHPERLDYVVSWWNSQRDYKTHKMHTYIHTERFWFAKICSDLLKYVRSANVKRVLKRCISNCSGKFTRKRAEIHGRLSLLWAFIVYINMRALCCLLSEALCSTELRRRCDDRLIPAFVECDEGGGKGGAEPSRLPAEPTNTSSQRLPRRRAIVPDSECSGPSLWDAEAECNSDGRKDYEDGMGVNSTQFGGREVLKWRSREGPA